MHRLKLSAVLLLILSASAAAVAQRGATPRPPLPPRDRPAAAPPVAAGTAAISGRVVVFGTGQPARRARVSLNAPDGGGSRSTMTDDDGRFAFNGLAGGRYTLSANKNGHVGVSFGAVRPGRPGTPIQLADGEKFTASLQLPRGGVITGTVLDEHGEPTAGVSVRVLRYAMTGGRRNLQESGGGSTDDRGIYRVYGLQPGDYIVSAVPRNDGGGRDIGRLQSELEGLRQRLGQSGVVDQAVAREVAQRVAMVQAQIGEAQEESSAGYAPVFYPGTMLPEQAQAIPLGIGEERLSVDFQLQRVALASVEGTVVNTSGLAVQNTQVTLTSAVPGMPGLGNFGARVDADGRFHIARVPPGAYRLVARAAVAGPGGANGPPGRGGRGPGAPPQIRLWASLDLPVEGRNLSNVVVTLQLGLTVSGRLVFNGTTQQAPTELNRLRATLTPVDAQGPAGLPAAAGTVDATGRFTIPSVVPGLYRLTAGGAGDAWTIESSVLDGQEALDVPVEIKPGGALSGTITFTDRRAELSGTIVDQRGQPAPEQTLILYAADERYWGPQSRRIRSTRPATDGRFAFTGIPPGEYKLVAMVDVEPGAWFDPAFLQQIDSASTRVSVAEGEQKVQNLQISNGGG